MNVWMSGQKYFAAQVLGGLLERGVSVVGASAPGDDRFSRALAARGVPTVPWGQLGEMACVLAGVDLIVCAHSWEFIPAAARSATRYGAIGYHPSLLPLHRGKTAVEDTLLGGDRVTGGTVYWLTGKMDAGPVALQEFCFVRPDDTPRSLWERDLCPMGIRLLLQVADDLGRGVVNASPQADLGDLAR